MQLLVGLFNDVLNSSGHIACNDRMNDEFENLGKEPEILLGRTAENSLRAFGPLFLSEKCWI
jgi:hypothetical protein